MDWIGFRKLDPRPTLRRQPFFCFVFFLGGGGGSGVPPVKRSTIGSRAFPFVGPMYLSLPAQNEVLQEVFYGRLSCDSDTDCILTFLLRLVCSNFETVLPLKDYDMM